MARQIQKKFSVRAMSEALKPLKHLLFGKPPIKRNYGDMDVRSLDLSKPIDTSDIGATSWRTMQHAAVRRLNADQAGRHAYWDKTAATKSPLKQKFYGLKEKFHNADANHWERSYNTVHNRTDYAEQNNNKKSLKTEIPYQALRAELALRNFIDENPRKAIIGTALAIEALRRASQKKDKPASSIGSGVKKRRY